MNTCLLTRHELDILTFISYVIFYSGSIESCPFFAMKRIIMDLVCDTNLWYDIGCKRLEPSRFQSEGIRLLATPVSFIEIASKVSSNTFLDRKKAASAVVNHASAILPDPERHLAEIWGWPIESLDFDWRDGFKVIADASNPEEIELGVDDLSELVRRKIKLPLLALWREKHWKGFEQDIINVIDGIYPGYKRAREAGKAKYMDSETRKALATFLAYPELIETTVMGTLHRVALHHQDDSYEPTTEQIQHAKSSLSTYAQAYARYIFKVATEFCPRPNDWGDLECFVYLQDDRQILTADQRWVTIAKEIAAPLYEL